MSGNTLRELFEIGLTLAALFAFGIFFLVIDFSSPQGNIDAVGRFAVGMLSIIAPTSVFDAFISISVAAIGGFTISRENAAMGVVAAVFLYGIVSFAIGWLTTPV